MSPYQINRLGVGRTFQDVRLITKLTVKQNIILAMQYNATDSWYKAIIPNYYHRDANTQIQQTAATIAAQYFLAEVENSLAGAISYGQQKLLTLACCVTNGANLLLLDEPVAGVQPVYRDKIAMLLKQLKQQGKTLLVIEHNTDFIGEIADEIFFLNNGDINIFDNINTLRINQQVMQAYT
jgi:ABC-type branched-subunit amino acid transport system ATPase component